MIRDLEQSLPDARRRFHVCVIGAGAAGITLAVELARAGKQVVMLEGGGSKIEAAAQEPYQSEHGGLAHRGLHEGRVRVYGGTTNRWGGQVLELDALDFEKRSWVAGSGWPFSKKELEPFYARALAVEGVDRSIQQDDAVWEELGVAEPRLSGLQSYLSRWCPEPNFARCHDVSIARSAGVELWLHANAMELVLKNGLAVGVRAGTQTGRAAMFHADDFVFCMGAIESSRFFLQPREGGRPWNQSGLLGRHFHDHIDCDAATLRPHSRKQLDCMFDGILLHGYKYQPKLRLLPEVQRQHGILNAGASLSYQTGMDEALASMRGTAKHLLRGNFGDTSVDDVLCLLRHAPTLLRQTLRYAIHRRSYQPATAGVTLRVHCEQEPCSQSFISLSKERDSLGLFRTRLSWKISILELKTIREFVKVASVSLAGVAKIVPFAGIDDDDALLSRCQDSFHHMGGMRMHDSPNQGVVNTDLKLHGTKNAWICSSAVFPTSGFSNPTHTLLALALRLSDRLCQRNTSFHVTTVSDELSEELLTPGEICRKETQLAFK